MRARFWLQSGRENSVSVGEGISSPCRFETRRHGLPGWGDSDREDLTENRLGQATPITTCDACGDGTARGIDHYDGERPNAATESAPPEGGRAALTASAASPA